MKIFGLQLDIVWEDRKANHARVSQKVAEAGIPAGSLVVLPEMFSSGFSMNVADVVEGDPSETEAFLAGLARKHDVTVVGGLVTAAAGGKGYNQALAYAPDGQLLARYTKIQPFTLGGEMDHYMPGKEVVTFDWQGGLVSPFICYDLRFPEIFRLAARRGAQLLLDIANWPDKRIDHWVTLLQARAVENQAYVLGVNRCGQDPHLSYNGRSVIFSPNGDLLADAGDQEGWVSAEVDWAGLAELRQGLPFLKDMRDDYDALA